MLIEFEVKIKLPVISLLGLNLERFKQVSDAVCGKYRLAKDAHDFNNWSANLKVMFNDCNEAICDDRDMNLNSNGILRLTPESLDLKMLLDPLEEQFHLPSISIKQGNFLCLEIEVVCVVGEAPVKVRCVIYDASDSTRIFLPVSLFGEADALVFKHIVFSIKDAFPINNLVCRLSFPRMMKKA